MIYLELFLGFLKVGVFTFGGGYAAVPLIRETVVAHGWLDDGRLSDMIAVSESTPGPIMVNMATYIGFTQGGLAGAAISTAAVVLPAFLVVLLLAIFLKEAMRHQGLKAAVDGVKPCVVGLIFATGLYMAAKNIFQPDRSFDPVSLALTAILAAIYYLPRIRKKNVSPIVLIAVAGAAGVLTELI